jgi:TolB protein
MGKYLLLAAFLALFAGWVYWRNSYGAIGRVAKLEGSTAGYIAFIRTDNNGASNLYIVKSDGTDLKPLTSDDTPKRTPCWSPDGTRVCYAQETRSEGSASYQLFVLGKGIPKQATYGSLSKDMPQWRPDGRQIAFLTGGAIKVISPNGADLEQVYPRPTKGNAPGGESQSDAPPEDAEGLRRPPITWFRWSPSGASLAGIQVLEGENAAAMGRANWWGKPAAEDDGPLGVVEPESVVVLPHLDAEPVWLPGANKVTFGWYPDGRRIVVALATRKGRHALVVFRTDEKNLPVTPLLSADTNTIAVENPAVSPDGKLIAAEVWRMEKLESRIPLGIAVMSAEAEVPVAVATAKDIAKLKLIITGDARSPQWSPDGRKLLYSMAGARGGTDIWVANADGSSPLNLTKGAGDNLDPVWSPARR